MDLLASDTIYAELFAVCKAIFYYNFLSVLPAVRSATYILLNINITKVKGVSASNK